MLETFSSIDYFPTPAPGLVPSAFSLSARPGVARPYFAFIARSSASFFSASTFLKALLDW